MAQHAVLSVAHLDAGYVLTPERYDPRRRVDEKEGIELAKLVKVASDIVSPHKLPPDKTVIVLDTNDAKDGFVLLDKELASASEIGSAKKILRSGDVIISRLRPYLRQVGLVGGYDVVHNDDVLICASTEFFVLRSKEGEDISYLVPFLLSCHVQEIICAAQEGGHHPRFNTDTLMRIKVPDHIIKMKESFSKQVRDAVTALAAARKSIRACVETM